MSSQAGARISGLRGAAKVAASLPSEEGGSPLHEGEGQHQRGQEHPRASSDEPREDREREEQRRNDSQLAECLAVCVIGEPELVAVQIRATLSVHESLFLLRSTFVHAPSFGEDGALPRVVRCGVS